MPVIIDSLAAHPFLPSVGSPSAIERGRASHQDIRPMEIAILNLMADKQTTERQLAFWLGRSAVQVQLTFAATDSYIDGLKAGRETRNTPVSHIHKFYSAFNDIRQRKFDGLIVTGVNALKDRVEQEDIWAEVCDILDWSTRNILSSLYLCWGAKAALKHFHGIDSIKGGRKLFGLFEHRLKTDSTGLLASLPDSFPVPVSRWKSPNRAAVAACKELEVAAESDLAGPNIMVEPETYLDGKQLFPRRCYVLNHPEYETDTLKQEYLRDHAANPDWPLPHGYFQNDDPAVPVKNSWRHTAQLYTNWVEAIYEATPYRIGEIPAPYFLNQPLTRAG